MELHQHCFISVLKLFHHILAFARLSAFVCIDRKSFAVLADEEEAFDLSVYFDADDAGGICADQIVVTAGCKR